MSEPPLFVLPFFSASLKEVLISSPASTSDAPRSLNCIMGENPKLSHVSNLPSLCSCSHGSCWFQRHELVVPLFQMVWPRSVANGLPCHGFVSEFTGMEKDTLHEMQNEAVKYR
jgi:hypothetical protein